MSRNLDSLTQLTEFGPPSPEPREPTVSSIFSKIFKFTRNESDDGSTPPLLPQSTSNQSNFPARSESSSQLEDKIKIDLEETCSLPGQLQCSAAEGRSLPNVLRRVSNLLALRNTGLQAYKDTDLQQYWMPDSKSKECYDCSSKFTLLVRRHHCRVCGQIFCYRCCNQEIPGKIMNCTGDLRVCTYCCKVVLSYLQSADVDADLSADLRALQEDLQSKFGSSDLSSHLSASENLNNLSANQKLSSCSLEKEDSVRRKTSIGYQEERFAPGRNSYFGLGSSITIEEKSRVLQNSSSLQDLIEEMKHPAQGLPFQMYKHRQRTYYSCFLGNQLVDWLIAHNKVVNRSQAAALSQALLDASLLECATAEQSFVDGSALYRFCSTPINSELLDGFETEQSENLSNSDNDFLSSNLVNEASNISLHLENSDSNLENVSNSNTQTKTSVLTDLEINGLYKLPGNCETSDVLTLTSLKNLISVYQDREPRLRPVNWHTVNPQTLRSDFQEAKVYHQLRNAFCSHRERFLSQLLAATGLPLSWIDIVTHLADSVVDDVKPDLSEDVDITNISQYVQVKKVVGGSRKDSFLVGGVVFTKNIAHRGMANRLVNPRILLIQCPIVFQRNEGKLLTLEPVMMQEQVYFRHVVSRIASLKPDVVLVHKSVSRLAQESLYKLNITLILNVKLSVLNRIARCTRADIITAVDAFFGKPHLGTCHYFHVETYKADSGMSKTLVFFEGCAFPHRGSTVILQSSSYNELSKLKKIMKVIIYMTYNWRLENSFLMDEFACPPSFTDDSFLSDPESPTKQKLEKTTVRKAKFTIGEETSKDFENSEQEASQKMCEKMSNDSGSVSTIKTGGNSEQRTEEYNMKESVNDYSDPLHLSLVSDDHVFSNMYHNVSNQTLSIAEIPNPNSFRKILDDTILCISPFLTFNIPYLETEAGKHCDLRRYFPNELYYSVLLEKDGNTGNINSHFSSYQTNVSMKESELSAVHPFVVAKLTNGIKHNEVQKLLALYRACGGRLKTTNDVMLKSNIVTNEEKQVKQPNDTKKIGKIDALDPSNHQKLAVLFCSFSNKSNNAPSFCVNPWIVSIDFYGPNDISLGRFLEQYCFRASYKCPSEICTTSMLEHERRFVHFNGCVRIVLQEIPAQPEKHLFDERILIWSWCPTCGIVTPVVPMSTDTWALSFAKYLELKFYGNMYKCRAFTEDRCGHSLHHEYCQYFALRNRVACFKYTNIMIWEISLPPPVLKILPPTYQQDAILDEMKEWALMGHEVFSSVLGKLCSLSIANESSIPTLKQQLQKDQAYFKSRVEEIQVKLTSPTLEKPEENNGAVQLGVLELEDAVVNLKRMVVETVDRWNSRILKVEALISAKKKDEKSKKTESKNPLVNSEPIIENPVASKHETDSITSSSTIEESVPLEDSRPSCGSQSAMVTSFEMATEVDEQVEQLNELKMTPAAVENESDVPVVKTAAISGEVENLNELQLKLPKSLKNCGVGVHAEGDVDSVFDSVDVDSVGGVVSESSAGIWSSEKKAVKNILMQLLPGATPDLPIQYPTNPTEHYALSSMSGSSVPIIVYENEPSSIIAHALSTHDYRLALSDLQNRKQSFDCQPSPNTVSKKRSICSEDPVPPVDGKKQKVFSFLRSQSSSSNVSQNKNNVEQPILSGSDEPEMEDSVKADVDVKSKPTKSEQFSNLEIHFSDATANFIVKIYKAEEFHTLRSLIYPIGEDAFIRSLSRCVQWAARGGKSGSNFCKTKDDRFVLKEMSRQETQLFLDFAPHYFSYIHHCHSSNQSTLLGKIVGVYRVIFRKVVNNTTVKTNLLIMENLFYGRSVTHKFDLKGSIRNRLVTLSEDQDGEIVLMDENFINMTCNSPLYVHPHAKLVLNQAIESDTQLLASRLIMDYSLLVGLDESKRELVVGIIDYIRTFTWDKKVEAMVKKSGLLGGQGKLPTIVSPDVYRERFITAMDSYFLLVPNHWSDMEAQNLK